MDLKPKNVLVAVVDDKPMPKIIDFGVAKAVGKHLTALDIGSFNPSQESADCIAGFGAIQ